MPRKTFTAGEVLAAADVNTFLMDQSVMTFADSTARGSAIPSPTEGMVTYLNDTNNVEVFVGTNFKSISSSPSGNAIINGAFDIWQRGTTFTNPVSSAYIADRFSHSFTGTGGTLVISRESFTPDELKIDNFGDAKFYYRYARTVAQTGAAGNTIVRQDIEDVQTFAGQTVTFSFWAKASTSMTVTPVLTQRFGSGGSSSTFTNGSEITLTTSWARYTSTITYPSISGKTVGAGSSAGFNLNSGLLNAIYTVDVWGVQLEAGSLATPFKRNANSLQGELAACQRYYFRQSGTGNLLGDTGVAYSTTAAIVPCGLPVEMRVPPTSVEFSTIALNDGVTSRNMTNVALYAGSNQFTAGLNVFGGSGLTQFRPYFLMTQTGVFGFIAYSAEL